MTSGLVSCIVGARQFAMRGTDVREIVRAERMRRDNRRERALGTLLLDGDAVPVYSLAAILDRTPARDEAPPVGHHIVVTRGAQGPAGWLVDRVVRSHLSDRIDVLPVPAIVATAGTRWFDGVLISDGMPLMLLSPEHLDPRDATDPARDDMAVPSPEPTSAVPPTDAAPPLVVVFSSTALPACGEARWALSARRIAAVVQSLQVTPIPGCPPHVIGLAAWRGGAIPVVDFRSADQRVAAVADHRFLIVRCGRAPRSESVALPVDSEVALHLPTNEDRPADDAPPAPAYVAGTFDVSGSRLALLDLDELLRTAPH